MTMELLKYPAGWSGGIKCDSSSFMIPTHSLQQNVHHGSYAVCDNCEESGYSPSFRLCACHGFCEDCCPPMTPKTASWTDVLKPFINFAVRDDKHKCVLDDCRVKLMCLDAANGLGVLHGLLAVSDDESLMKQFLELGVNPELKYVRIEAPAGTSNTATAAVPKSLDGGTALHFACHFVRPKCVALLVGIGASLVAKNFEGKIPSEMTKDVSISDILKNTGSIVTFAQMAKDSLWHAMRFKMRSGQVLHRDLTGKCEGKTALEWVGSHMREWHFSPKFEEDSLIPFKVMAEIKFRYEAEAAGAMVKVPSIQLGNRSDGSASNGDGNGDGDGSTENEKLLHNLMEMFQGTCLTLRENIQELKDGAARNETENRTLKSSIQKLKKELAQLKKK